MDDKNQRFERLAEKRVTETIKKMRLIGNLANKRNYAYTDDHVKQIMDALENEMRLLKGRFKEETSELSSQFRFTRRAV